MYNQSVGSYSSVGQSVRLITVRSAVQARVGAFFVAVLPDVKKSKVEELCCVNGSMAEWSKAPALGAGPKGRGFEPHCCQIIIFAIDLTENKNTIRAHMHLHVGLWCSGITSALHAEGLGFKPRQVHSFIAHRLTVLHEDL